jgi:hypothetical protein
MKFLVTVLAIHFIVELISNNRKKEKENINDGVNERIIHPSEYRVR